MSIVWDDQSKLVYQALVISLINQVLDVAQMGLPDLNVFLRTHGATEHGVRCGARLFIIIEQLLIKFFPRSQAGINDGNVLARSSASQHDEFLSQLADFNEAPHFKYENVPPCPIQAAWRTSCTASGIVMKNRSISG